MRALACLAAVLATSAQAADPWDAKDITLGAAALTVQAIDYAQTTYIAKHPNTYREVAISSLVSEHPSTGRVNTFFALETVAIGAAAHLLPAPYRDLLLGGVIVVKIDAIGKNYALGIKMDLP